MAVISIDHVYNDEDFSSESLLQKESYPDKRSKPSKKQRYKDDDPLKEKAPTFSQWLFRNPLSKLPFIYFSAGVVGAFGLAVFHFMDSDTAYLICAAYIALSAFGCKYFYTLIGLKKQVDEFGSLNQKFSAQHNQLAVEVKRLSKATDSLRESQERIQKANAKNRENLSQFHGIQETMQTLNLQTVDELKDVAQRANAIGDKWQGQVIERERDLLHTVFDRFEDASGKNGMTRGDFEQFASQLPQSYQQRFARLGTFRKIAGDQKILNFSDFDAALDTFAEMEALDVDIDFTIEKKTKGGKSLTVPTKKTEARKSTLRVMANDDVDDFDISAMKRWKTRRKVYDSVSRNVVIKSKHFRTQTAQDFAIGILDEEDEKQNVIQFVEDDEDDDEFDEEAYFSGGDTLKTLSIGRDSSMADIVRHISGDEGSEKDLLLQNK